MKVCIVGIGEIGKAVYKEIEKRKDSKNIKESIDLFCIDKEDKIPIADIYNICVYTQDQIEKSMIDIMKVNKELNKQKPILFIIEATCNPNKLYWFIKFYLNNNCDIVFFPHRYNPNDKKHHIFNLDRLLGGISKESEQRAYSFIYLFMDKKLIHITKPSIAIIAKPIENAYRFLEIAFAEGLKLWCDKQNIDFSELRKCINTKWNINIKEARDGIGGKCLPKDTKLVQNIPLLKNALDLDKKYRKYLFKEVIK